MATTLFLKLRVVTVDQQVAAQLDMVVEMDTEVVRAGAATAVIGRSY